MMLRKATDYKETGIAWLNKVPKNWDILQSKRLFSERKEKARPEDKQMTASQKYGVIYQEDFMKLENQKVVQVVTGSDILKHVEPHDFVISMRSFQGGLEYSKDRGCISSAYVMLIPSKDVVPNYFRYLFKSSAYIQALQITSNLVRDGQAMRYSNFTQVPLPSIPKEETLGQDLGDSTFNWVKPNDLIFSGQFAWEGAVALASVRENQKIASHRYPIYNAKNGIENGYLFSYFRTHRGKFLMDDCSRGAAGRNRPLNTNRLEKELIPIPAKGIQDAIVKLVQQEDPLKEKIKASIEILNMFKSSLVTEAVTGQLDIQAWQQRGMTDRRLDKIEEDMERNKRATA